MATKAGSRSRVAAGGERGPLLGLDLLGSMWSVHHALARTPRPRATNVAARLRMIEEELAVRDVLARYTYFYDGADIDGVMSVFHEKCVLINPRGTYIGAAAIRRNYAYLISLSKIVLHFAPNVMVRLDSRLKSAWMTAYYYGVSATPASTLIATGGTYADRLVKEDGAWKIVARRITYNVRHTLAPEAPGGLSAAPRPSRPRSSRDIVGPGAEM